MILVLLLACAKPTELASAGSGVSWADLRRDGVALAPVVLVQELPAPPLPPQPPPRPVELEQEIAHLPPPTQLDPVTDGPFLRNDYIGNIRFGGGFIRTGEVALEVRARLVEFTQQAAYAAQGSRWLGDTLRAELDRHRLVVTTAGVSPPPPERIPRRGMHADDGRDNVNLPRVGLAPAPLPTPAHGWLLVPYLRAYYSHNGGWFLGQTWGTTAGARVEVLLVLYDERGQPAWWMTATGRHIQEMRSQPSSSELDQYLLEAEEQVEGAIRRRMLR